MDTGSTLVGAIIAIVCIVPFIVMTLNRKKREKQKLQLLINVANEQSCKIDEHEIGSDYVIGIDREKKYIFFNKKIRGIETSQYVNLNLIKACKVNYPTNSKSDYVGEIDKLSLNFIPINKNESTTNFEFYNMHYSIQLSGELESIKKWSKIIENQLK